MTIKFRSNNREISLDDVLYRIEYADHDEIDAMIDAVQRCYSRLFPDWEVAFLSIHAGDQAECTQQVEQVIQMLKKLYLE